MSATETGPVSPSAIRAARELRVGIGRLRRRLREVADADELTPTQTSVLSRLLRDEPMSLSDLATAERVRPQSMAATVAVLVERGFVERRPDPEDGRRQLLSLTAPAHAYVEGARQAREEWLAGTLQDRFTESERRTIVEALALLERVTDA